MSEDNNEVKTPVQTKRLRGRNHFDVVSQLVETYNASNGWSLVKVVGNALSVDVYLERSSKQGEPEEVVDEKKLSTEAPKQQVDIANEEEQVPIKQAETKAKTTASKRAPK